MDTNRDTNRTEAMENVHRLPTETCPMCEVKTGGVGSEPDDPVSLKIQIDNLQRRLGQLRKSELSPRQVRELLPQMCPYCQEALAGVEGATSQEAMDEHLARLITRLQERLAQYEHHP